MSNYTITAKQAEKALDLDFGINGRKLCLALCGAYRLAEMNLSQKQGEEFGIKVKRALTGMSIDEVKAGIGAAAERVNAVFAEYGVKA